MINQIDFSPYVHDICNTFGQSGAEPYVVEYVQPIGKSSIWLYGYLEHPGAPLAGIAILKLYKFENHI